MILGNGRGSRAAGSSRWKPRVSRYLLTAAHGLDASQYTFNYVAGWAHQATTTAGPSVEDIIKATGQRVISTADRILQFTQPAPTLTEEALADLAVQVTRPRDAVAPAATWERIASPALDGAAQERRTGLGMPVSPASTMTRSGEGGW